MLKNKYSPPSLIEGSSFGAARFFICVGMLIFQILYWNEYLIDIPRWQKYSEDFWLPVGAFPFISYPLIQKIPTLPVYLLNLFSLFFMAFGVKSRFAAFTSLITSLFLFGIPNNFGTVYDSTCMIHLFFLVALFSPNLKQYSWDQKRKGPFVSKINDYSLFFIQALFLLFYSISAIQKLRISGLNFFNSDHLSLIFLSNGNPLGVWFSQFLTFNKFVAFLVLIFQLFCFLPIFFKGFTKFFIIGILLFHISVNLTLGPHFYPHVLLIFLFLPYEKILPALGSSIKIGKKTKLLNLIFLPLIGFFFILSPITKTHYWPFSTMTMFSWPAQYETEQFQLMSNKGNIPFSSFSPYDHDRLHSLFEQLFYKEESIRLKAIVTQLKGQRKDIEELGLFLCSWANTKQRIQSPQSPQRCEEVAITN